MANNTQFPDDFEYEEEDIEEVELLKSGQEVADLGTVELWELIEVSLKILQASEKARARSYITGIAITLWSICTSVCLIRFLMTGEFVLIGPPTLLGVPICLILKFYFKGD